MSSRAVKRFTLLVLALLPLAGLACAHAKIELFTATPHRICQDQATTLTWAVKGTPELSAEPSLPGTGGVAAQGSRQFSPDSTTVFTLRVTRGKDAAYARQEIVVYRTDAEVPIVIAAEPYSLGGLIAVTTAPAADWDDALRIARVANASDRALVARHGGREVSLAAGGTSDALRGLAVSGLWELQAGLLPGEILGDPEHAPADRLRLRLTLACGE